VVIFKFDSSADRNEFADCFPARGRDAAEGMTDKSATEQFQLAGAAAARQLDTAHAETKFNCSVYYVAFLH
jgi:hypothetical protein